MRNWRACCFALSNTAAQLRGLQNGSKWCPWCVQRFPFLASHSDLCGMKPKTTFQKQEDLVTVLTRL